MKKNLRICPQPDGSWFLISGGGQYSRVGNVIAMNRSTIEARCATEEEAKKKLGQLEADGEEQKQA